MASELMSYYSYQLCVANSTVLRQQIHTYVLWYSRENSSKNDTEERKFLNKVIIFLFFAHKSILVAS